MTIHYSCHCRGGDLERPGLLRGCLGHLLRPDCFGPSRTDTRRCLLTLCHLPLFSPPTTSTWRAFHSQTCFLFSSCLLHCHRPQFPTSKSFSFFHSLSPYFPVFLSSTLQISHPLIFYIILLRIITSPGCCLASFPSLPFLSPHLKSFPFNFSFSYCKNLSPKQPQFSFLLRLSDCHFS